MIPLRLDREDVEGRPADKVAAELAGLVLVEDVGKGRDGRIRKGTVLEPDEARRLLELEWEALHLLRPEEGEVHEEEAGERLARAVAGEGVEVGAFSGGAWPLRARHRGILQVRVAALDAVNALEGLTVYAHLDGRIVDRDEEVARAKVIPFLVPGLRLGQAESRAAESGGVLSVRPFRSLRVAAVVQESLGEAAVERFRDALRSKLGWFGSELDEPRFVAPDPGAVEEALGAVLDRGARVVLVAGTRAMDPLDPAFRALDRVGATLVRHGVPAHPGSLLWLARKGEVSIVGVPSCGLFSKATVFDLVLARLLAGLPTDAGALAAMGHGGFLTPDMAWRFPPYGESSTRGEVG